MFDLRKLVIIFVIAVLFSILVHSSIDAFYPAPNRNDFCKDKYSDPYIPDMQQKNCKKFIPSQDEKNKCFDDGGFIGFEYDDSGCPIAFKCNMCEKQYDDARSKYNLFYFVVVAITSLIAISLGLFLPDTNRLNTWVGTGFMLGGLFMLFFSTFRSYDDIIPLLRPLIILGELIIVLYVSYKTLSSINEPVKDKNIRQKKR